MQEQAHSSCRRLFGSLESRAPSQAHEISRSGIMLFLLSSMCSSFLSLLTRAKRMLRMRDGCLNTLVPEGRVVLIKEKRLLTGFEALRVQGFPEAPLVQFAKEQGGPTAVDVKFFYLAGNAFSAPAIAAVVVSIVTHLTEVHLSVFRSTRQAAAGSGAVPDDDNDDVMELFRSSG